MTLKQAIKYLAHHGFAPGHEGRCQALKNGYLECNCKAQKVKVVVHGWGSKYSSRVR